MPLTQVSEKWSEQMKALQLVIDGLGPTPKVKAGCDVHDIVAACKGFLRLPGSHLQVLMGSLKVVSLLAEGMRSVPVFTVYDLGCCFRLRCCWGYNRHQWAGLNWTLSVALPSLSNIFFSDLINYCSDLINFFSDFTIFFSDFTISLYIPKGGILILHPTCYSINNWEMQRKKVSTSVIFSISESFHQHSVSLPHHCD